MALTDIVIAVRYYFRDSDGKSLWCEIWLDPSNYEGAFLFSQRLTAKLAPLTSCLFDYAQFSYRRRESTAMPGDTTGNLYNHGAFVFLSAPEQRHVLAVPAIKSDLLATSGDWAGIALDTTNADVAAWVDNLLNGDGTTSACDYNENDLTSLVAAYLQWRPVVESNIAKG